MSAILRVRQEDGSVVEIPAIVGPQGPQGPAGSDANVTTANIENALGYTPADEKVVIQLSEDTAKLSEKVENLSDGKTYDPSAEGLPLVVSDTCAATPSPLTAKGIYGAELIVGNSGGGISDDLTAERRDGFYVLEDTGGDAPFNGLSIGRARIESGKTYYVTLWSEPGTTNVLGFYNSDVTSGTAGYFGKEFAATVGFTLVDAENGVYSFTAPEGVIRINYTYWTEKGGFIKEEISDAENAYKLPWLRIYPENLSDEVKEAVVPVPTVEKKTYGHSLTKPFNFNGKKLVAFGDSITFGITSPGLAYTYTPWIRTFAEKCGMNWTNNAVSGTCITDSDDDLGQNSMYKKLTAFVDSADVILIAGGTNDYGTGKPIGDYDSTDEKTLYGAMRGICSALAENHPDATVIFVTPLPRTDNTSAVVAPLNDYRNAIFEVASEYGFNVVDGSMLGFPTETGGFNDFMLADGCHPTQAGHNFYAKNLYAVLV